MVVKGLQQNNRFLEKSRPSKIKSLQRYIILWVHVIDAICNANARGTKVWKGHHIVTYVLIHRIQKSTVLGHFVAFIKRAASGDFLRNKIENVPKKNKRNDTKKSLNIHICFIFLFNVPNNNIFGTLFITWFSLCFRLFKFARCLDKWSEGQKSLLGKNKFALLLISVWLEFHFMHCAIMHEWGKANVFLCHTNVKSNDTH